jgi:hypothetical protein
LRWKIPDGRIVRPAPMCCCMPYFSRQAKNKIGNTGITSLGRCEDLFYLSCETPHVRNSEPQNIEYRTAQFRSEDSLRSVFFKIDRIHHFDIRYSVFDIRYSIFAFSQFLLRSDWTLAARGGAHTEVG